MPNVAKPRRLLKSRLDGDILHTVQYPESLIDSDYSPASRTDESGSNDLRRTQRAPRISIERVFPDDFASNTSSADSSSQSSTDSSRTSTPRLHAIDFRHESLRAKRHWTVDLGGQRVSQHGVERHAAWVDKDIVVSALKTDHKGEYFRTQDRQRHYIANKSDPFFDSKGRRVCRVSFRATWIPEDLVDPLISDPSSSPTSFEPAVHSSTPPGFPNLQSPHLSPPSSGELPHRRMTTNQRKKVRQPTAASDISFSNLKVGRVKGLRDHPRSAIANYDAAIDTVIKDGIKTGLIATTTGACPPCISKHINKPSVRSVQFREGYVDKPNWTFNFRNVSNAAAFYAHRSGYSVVVPCHVCEAGRGVFQGCVVADDFVSGTCTNCAYNGQSGRQCSFRKDTSDYPHQPAQRIQRPKPLADSHRAKKHKRRHTEDVTALPSPPTSDPLPTGNQGDFIASSDNAGHEDTDFLMSGALASPSVRSAPRSAPYPESNVSILRGAPRAAPALRSEVPTPPSTPPSLHSAVADTRRAKRRRERQEQEAREDRRSQSVVVVSESRVAAKGVPEGDDEHQSRKMSIESWLAAQSKPVGRTPVYKDSTIGSGKMTAEEFWYVVDTCCMWSTQEHLRNQYRWYRYDVRRDHGVEYDWSFWEYFAFEDFEWFRVEVIRRFCPARP